MRAGSRCRRVRDYLGIYTFPDVDQVRSAYNWYTAMGTSHWRHNLKHSKGAYIVLARALEHEQALQLREHILRCFQNCNVIFQSEREKCCRSRGEKLKFVVA